ncbi:transcriptional activator RhaR [Escherichia coli]|nr:transcriptional activator RhaR [Escherichia coli]GDK16117.1 transcriptional activator RhaR [Escherichia coli]GDL02213.1 transcriptional activator RhaR [Escherichia coli]GDP66520.1 transcriptional activator RhaR [Escherichia coli]
MAFCNNANLLNVFVRHIANNQLRSLAEVATVAHQLKLLKDDFFASDQQAVAVADRYPQDVFAEHTHDFCELVIVCAVMACMYSTIALIALPVAISFTFMLTINTPTLPLTIWFCRILFIARSV